MNQELRSKNQEPTANPFSTRYIRPGAIAYQFPADATADSLTAQLAAHNWQGEIIGPHGSGKSTLLASLLPAIDAAGRRPRLITLHDGERKLPIDLSREPELGSPTVVAIDGYEQLSRWSRIRLSALCRRRGWGLLVTAHQSVGLPPLYQTETTLDVATGLVAQLLGPQAALISRREIAERLAHRSGNLRDVLFDLYDIYEQRRQRAD